MNSPSQSLLLHTPHVRCCLVRRRTWTCSPGRARKATTSSSVTRGAKGGWPCCEGCGCCCCCGCGGAPRSGITLAPSCNRNWAVCSGQVARRGCRRYSGLWSTHAHWTYSESLQSQYAACVRARTAAGQAGPLPAFKDVPLLHTCTSTCMGAPAKRTGPLCGVLCPTYTACRPTPAPSKAPVPPPAAAGPTASLPAVPTAPWPTRAARESPGPGLSRPGGGNRAGDGALRRSTLSTARMGPEMSLGGEPWAV